MPKAERSLSIWDLLRQRFAAPTYAYIEEVRNGTGFGRRVTRTADALAYCTWNSRGLELHGIEVKISRGDWLKELNDPSKSDEIQRFCDRWWLAVSDDKIVKPGELPPNWGLLVKKGNRLVCTSEAPKLEAQPLDRLMLAAIFRKVTTTYMPRSNITVEIEAAKKEAYEKGIALNQPALDRVQRELDDLRAAVRQFEVGAGVQIERYRNWSNHNTKLGEAVRVVMDGGVKKYTTALADITRQFKRLAGEGQRALEAIGATPEQQTMNDEAVA